MCFVILAAMSGAAAAIASATRADLERRQLIPRRHTPKCDYCGTNDNTAGQNCRNCGAPLPTLDLKAREEQIRALMSLENCHHTTLPPWLKTPPYDHNWKP